MAIQRTFSIIKPDAVAKNVIGEITSGGFSPTLGGPIAMGYVDAAHAAKGTNVNLMVRGKAMPAQVTSPIFVEHRYFRD